METHFEGADRQWSTQELQSEFPDCGTLAQIIDAVSAQAKSRGAVICKVTVNGVNLTEEQEARFHQMAVGEIRDFGVKIQDIGMLLDESLVSCCQYLGKLAESLDRAAELFRTEETETAQKYYQACLDGAALFVDMAKHFKIVFEKERGEIPFDWARTESAMAAVMNQILEAYRDRDYILVADLLEYELVGLLNRWQQDLSKLERDKTRHGGTVPEIQT